MLANSKKQILSEHSFAVGYLAKLILERNISVDNNSSEQVLMLNRAFISGLLHDIGKVDEHYQRFVVSSEDDDLDNGSHINSKDKKFSFEKYPRHNELSLVISEALFEESVFNDFYKKYEIKSSRQAVKKHKEFIQHSLLWHHSVPIRKNKFETMGSCLPKVIKDNIDSIVTDSLKLLNEIEVIASRYLNLGDATVFNEDCIDDVIEAMSSLKNEVLPRFKSYPSHIEDPDDLVNEVQSQANFSLIRTSVMMADQLVSSLSSKELSELIETKKLNSLILDKKENRLIAELESHSDCFYPGTERTLLQVSKADELINVEGIPILKGAAGSGKTKIACEWAKGKCAEKMMFIVPRVSVGLSLYTELTSKDYLPNSRVQLNTGEIKKSVNCETSNESELFNSDIIITTIDQVVGALNSNRNLALVKMFLTSYVVFDEFHEFTKMNALNVLFAELVSLKRFNDFDKCLLVSATPDYVFLSNLFEVDVDDVISMDSYNETNYKVIFEDYDSSNKDIMHPSCDPKPNDSLVITNTVYNAQCGYTKNKEEKSLLVHSYFSKNDKQDLIYKILDSHGKNGDKSLDIVRSAPVIQASFNISFENLFTDFTTPDDLCQRIGRVSRFGEKDSSNITIYVPESISCQNINKDTEGRVFNSRNVFSIASKWYEFLIDNISGRNHIKIKELYELYDDFFYNFIDDENIEKEFTRLLNQSLKTIYAKVHDPLWIKPKKGKSNRLSANSLRGDSFYAKVAACDIVGDKISYRDEYLDELVVVDGNVIDKVLDYFVQQHPKIDEFKKVGRSNKAINNNSIVKLKSRSDLSPIFLSYTPDHLDEVNQNIHDDALYYVYIDGNPLGLISSDKLTKLAKNTSQ